MRESTLRISLGIACPFNLLAAALFAFPGGVLGQQVGLPAEVPTLYAALVALFVGLFGVTYGWLAVQPRIDRPLLWLGAIGKFAAFAVAVGLWLIQQLSTQGAATAVGDLAFASIWVAWLRGSAHA